MNKTDAEILLEQIRNIVLNQPISKPLKSENKELADLQEAILYLSDCLSESTEFLKCLSMGNLDVRPPGRNNFLAGSLKELHAGLRHLTWQANQVANGDYYQKVSFLGDFSTSFNQMVSQLSEREDRLKRQSTVLEETVALTKSIMDGLKDWIVVTDTENGEIIYTNQAAKQLFYDAGSGQHKCGESCGLVNSLKQYRQKKSDQLVFEYTCPFSKKNLRTRSYLIQWNDRLAYAHYVTDVTYEKEYQEQIVEMAYTDELTGLFNRRYLIEQLDELLLRKERFTCCIVDLDGLKYANDNFGHPAGDQYLQLVTEQMLKEIRSTDCICRIGGDEFAILFPGGNLQIISDKMKRLNARIEALSTDYPMSVSYGAVEIDEDMEILSETVLAQADEEMYALKNRKKKKQKTQSI